jgi:hypothetical protein
MCYFANMEIDGYRKPVFAFMTADLQQQRLRHAKVRRLA